MEVNQGSLESPPLVRGLHGICRINICSVRITPACAGITLPPGMGGQEDDGGEDDTNFPQAEGTPQKVTDAKTDANGNDHSESDGRFVTKGGGGAKNTKNDLQSSKSNGNVYSRIEDRLRNEKVDGKPLLNHGEKVMMPKPIKLKSINTHAFRHSVTLEEAQKFVDEAFIMLKQSEDKNAYIARDGTAVVIDPARRVVTAYGLQDYNNRQLRILEVVLDVLQNG